MVAPTTQRPQGRADLDGRSWGLHGGILTEGLPGTGRVALWLPAGQEGSYQLWERVAPAEETGFAAGPGVRAVAATALGVRQWAGGRLGQWFRRATGVCWLLPNGQTGEQRGARRSDLLLLWAEDEGAPLEDGWVQSRWPQAEQVQRLGKNLHLLWGVKRAARSAQAAPAQRPECARLYHEARLTAERMLQEARAAGDRAREASALADLGAIYRQQGNTEAAIAVLGEALTLARQLGDRGRQSDILGTLGLLTLAAGHAQRALELFTLELAAARQAGDRYAEKLALERVGLAHVRLKQHAEALTAFGQALALARAVGHRQHQADLLWSLGIAHAELGQRDQAVAQAQAAVTLMQEMGSPQAAVFAEQLQRYRAGGSGSPPQCRRATR
jgi:tetratricopeptide (TPR) repeat protein